MSPSRIDVLMSTKGHDPVQQFEGPAPLKKDRLRKQFQGLPKAYVLNKRSCGPEPLSSILKKQLLGLGQNSCAYIHHTSKNATFPSKKNGTSCQKKST